MSSRAISVAEASTVISSVSTSLLSSSTNLTVIVLVTGPPETMGDSVPGMVIVEEVSLMV